MGGEVSGLARGGMLEVAAGRQGEVAGAGGEGWGGGETGTAMVAAAETVAAGVAGRGRWR